MSMAVGLIGALIGLIGLVVGRFLSVLVGAAPEGVAEREAIRHRPGCGCRAEPLDFLPVVWWLRNMGRCRGCDRPVGILYPSVELVTAGLFVGAFYLVGPDWSLPAYLCFLAVTIVLGFIDLGHRRIPNRILLPGTVVGLVLLTGGAVLEGRIGDLPEALAAGLGYFVVLLVPAFSTRGAIGMGDVKLAFLLGVFAGYGRWEGAVVAAIGAFVLAGVVAVPLLIFRILSRRDHLPFGPFMVAGSWIAIALELAAETGLT